MFAKMTSVPIFVFLFCIHVLAGASPPSCAFKLTETKDRLYRLDAQAWEEWLGEVFAKGVKREVLLKQLAYPLSHLPEHLKEALLVKIQKNYGSLSKRHPENESRWKAVASSDGEELFEIDEAEDVRLREEESETFTPKRATDIVINMLLKPHDFFAQQKALKHRLHEAYFNYLHWQHQWLSSTLLPSVILNIFEDIQRVLKLKLLTAFEGPALVFFGSFPMGRAIAGQSDLDFLVSEKITPKQKAEIKKELERLLKSKYSSLGLSATQMGSFGAGAGWNSAAPFFKSSEVSTISPVVLLLGPSQRQVLVAPASF